MFVTTLCTQKSNDEYANIKDCENLNVYYDLYIRYNSFLFIYTNKTKSQNFKTLGLAKL